MIRTEMVSLLTRADILAHELLRRTRCERCAQGAELGEPRGLLRVSVDRDPLTETLWLTFTCRGVHGKPVNGHLIDACALSVDERAVPLTLPPLFVPNDEPQAPNRDGWVDGEHVGGGFVAAYAQALTYVPEETTMVTRAAWQAQIAWFSQNSPPDHAQAAALAAVLWDELSDLWLHLPRLTADRDSMAGQHIGLWHPAVAHSAGAGCGARREVRSAGGPDRSTDLRRGREGSAGAGEAGGARGAAMTDTIRNLALGPIRTLVDTFFPKAPATPTFALPPLPVWATPSRYRPRSRSYGLVDARALHSQTDAPGISRNQTDSPGHPDEP